MAKIKRITDDTVAEVPISSMIDIVFLLIIFFIVTATIDKEAEDQNIILTDAPHGRPITKQDPRTITINVRQDGTMTLGTHIVTPQQITALLEDIKRKDDDPMSIPIVIRGDHNAQHHYISRALEAVKATGLYKVNLTGRLEQ